MYLQMDGNERRRAALLDGGISMWLCLRPMLDGMVAAGDNDIQCVKAKYSTRQAACSGSVGNSLWPDLLAECQQRAMNLPYLLRESFSDIIQVVSLKLFRKLVTS